VGFVRAHDRKWHQAAKVSAAVCPQLVKADSRHPRRICWSIDQPLLSSPRSRAGSGITARSAPSVARYHRSTASRQGHPLRLLRARRGLQCIVGHREGEGIFVGLVVSGAGIVHGFAPLRLPPGHQGDAHQQDDSVRWGRPSILKPHFADQAARAHNATRG
jgi:hypothetical protein